MPVLRGPCLHRRLPGPCLVSQARSAEMRDEQVSALLQGQEGLGAELPGSVGTVLHAQRGALSVRRGRLHQERV